MVKKRLIDANELSDRVAESKHSNPHQQGMVRVNHRNEHDHFLQMIYITPTVDAVEVVRCEKCRFYEQGVEYYGGGTKDVCRLLKRQMQEDDFCSYGERRTDG